MSHLQLDTQDAFLSPPGEREKTFFFSLWHRYFFFHPSYYCLCVYITPLGSSRANISIEISVIIYENETTIDGGGTRFLSASVRFSGSIYFGSESELGGGWRGSLNRLRWRGENRRETWCLKRPRGIMTLWSGSTIRCGMQHPRRRRRRDYSSSSQRSWRKLTVFSNSCLTTTSSGLLVSAEELQISIDPNRCNYPPKWFRAGFLVPFAFFFSSSLAVF